MQDCVRVASDVAWCAVGCCQLIYNVVNCAMRPGLCYESQAQARRKSQRGARLCVCVCVCVCVSGVTNTWRNRHNVE